MTLVSPYSRQIYSGMLPGWIAGYYALEDCSLALDSLARRAGARFVQLAENLRAICEGQSLKSRQPQKRALYLLNTGRKYAPAAWGGFSVSGSWVWRWKDRIDRPSSRDLAPELPPTSGRHLRHLCVRRGGWE